MPTLPEQQRQIEIEVESEKIIKQDQSYFLQTSFKAPPAHVQPVNKLMLEKKLQVLREQKTKVLEKFEKDELTLEKLINDIK